MSIQSYWAIQSQALREELAKTRTELWNTKREYQQLSVIALTGWVLVVFLLGAGLFIPRSACASELEPFTSIVIRCQQADDTCVKRELVYPTEAACEAENEAVVAAIGKTSDIVVAYCVGGGE